MKLFCAFFTESQHPISSVKGRHFKSSLCIFYDSGRAPLCWFFPSWTSPQKLTKSKARLHWEYQSLSNWRYESCKLVFICEILSGNTNESSCTVLSFYHSTGYIDLWFRVVHLSTPPKAQHLRSLTHFVWQKTCVKWLALLNVFAPAHMRCMHSLTCRSSFDICMWCVYRAKSRHEELRLTWPTQSMIC